MDTYTLSENERVILLSNELTKSKGFEFVVFSNIRINQVLYLPHNIMLVPCFMDEIIDPKYATQIKRRIEAMEIRARFIYDGWVPLAKVNVKKVHQAIKRLERAMVTLSFQMYGWMTWEPKYYAIRPRAITQSSGSPRFSSKIMQEFERLYEIICKIPIEDRYSLLSGIGWFNQSLHQSEPITRYLFLIFALESLVNYIELQSKPYSKFFPLRSQEYIPPTEKREKREQCIQIKLQTPEEKLSNKIREAYFECIMSISKIMKSHVKKIFGDNLDNYDLLFKGKGSLHNLRHTIAHGGINAVSDLEREKIKNRVNDLEVLTRSYLFKVLEPIYKPLKGINLTSERPFPIDSFISDHERIPPIHMVLYYG